MSAKSNIEWTQRTWNFLRGCSRVSEGCKNCYAERQAIRFAKPGEAYGGLVRSTPGGPKWTGEISFHEEVLLEALKWRTPQTVFVNSMSDLFHEKVPDEMLDKAFAVMALTPQHTYQILTKRPERMLEYMTGNDVEEHWAQAAVEVTQSPCACLTFEDLEYPIKNIWLGVSVEDQKTADERIPLLLETPAAVRWISAEPLLGPIDLDSKDLGSLQGWHLEFSHDYRCDGDCLNCPDISQAQNPRLDWVVVGGESGPNARPMNIDWMRTIVNDCYVSNVPVFVKQLGRIPTMSEDAWRNAPTARILSAANAKYVPSDFVGIAMSDKKGGKIDEFPEDLRVREYPGRSMEASA